MGENSTLSYPRAMSLRSHRHHALSRRLLSVMGLGSMTGLALASAACGGHAAGGGTGGVGSSSAVGGGGGANMDCDTLTEVGDTLQQVCVDDPPAGCPAYPESQIAAQLGLCDLGTNPCCGQPSLVRYVCGPMPTPAGTCCYTVVTRDMEPCP